MRVLLCARLLTGEPQPPPKLPTGQHLQLGRAKHTCIVSWEGVQRGVCACARVCVHACVYVCAHARACMAVMGYDVYGLLPLTLLLLEGC